MIEIKSKVTEAICANEKCKNNKFYAWGDSKSKETILYCDKCGAQFTLEFKDSYREPLPPAPSPQG